MPIQILRPEDIPAISHARAGIVAQNGVGKTFWAATIPEMDTRGQQHRVLYASVDIENLRAVLAHKHYRPVKLNLWNDLLDLYDLVVQSLAGKNPVTDLVFDTWSRMQDLAVGKVTGYNPTDPDKLREYIDRIPKRPEGWNGWGQVGSLMNEWMANFNRLPVSTYWLLQEMNREERYDETLDTGPRLTPEAARGIKDALEIIGRMYVELEGEEVVQIENLTEAPDTHNRRINEDAKEVRKLLVGKHERYFAKGPTHLLGRVITNPTWDNTIQPILTQTPRPELSAPNGKLTVS